MPLSDYARDKYVAPDMSKFTKAELPDLSKIDAEQEHWLANFILNTMFRKELRPDVRQRFFNFLRRTRSAFEEYTQARDTTLSFLTDRSSDLRFLTAVGHWEAFLEYAWQAYALLDGGRRTLFESGDDSVLDRLNRLHGRAKHVEKAINSGQFPGDTPLCVWLTNSGLTSTDATLSFEEVGHILRDLAQLAALVQDPATMQERLAGSAEAKP